MIRHPREEPLTGRLLRQYILKHEIRSEQYKALKNQYLSKPPILDQETKDPWKPDNRITVNFGKYLVDTFNGYFSGIPVKIQHDDEVLNEVINDFWSNNDMDDVFAELSKITSLYGQGYLYLYQNEETETKVAYVEPMNIFVIYSDEIRPHSLYAVRYERNKYGGYQGSVFAEDKELMFELYGEELKTEEVQGINPYGRIPIIEFVENEERMSLIEPVESMINAYNKALSEKANDVDYFADAYLAIVGAELAEEEVTQIRDNRVINLFGTDESSKVKIEFLDKPDGDTSQENLLNRLERLIYQTSMISNINDENFGNASGVSLEFKLQTMKNLAAMKERKFTAGLNTMFQMFLNVVTNVPKSLSGEWKDIQYTFTRNMPRNLESEAETASKLDNLVSKETMLSTLSIVDDPKNEIERIEEDKESSSLLARNIDFKRNALSDSDIGAEENEE